MKEPEPTPQDDPRDHIGNADSMIEYEYKDRDLPVPLTDPERLQLGQDMAGDSHMVTAIQTAYAGCLFRSRLEARWAVVFDVLGLNVWRFGRNCAHERHNY